MCVSHDEKRHELLIRFHAWSIRRRRTRWELPASRSVHDDAGISPAMLKARRLDPNSSRRADLEAFLLAL
jgi:hypothetical protein